MAGVIGGSHICGSCSNPTQKAGLLADAGYEILFSRHDPAGPAQKNAFLRYNNGPQDVCFLKSTAGLAVELLDHRSPSELDAPYHILLGTPSGAMLIRKKGFTNSTEQALSEAVGYDVEVYHFPGTGLSYYGPSGPYQASNGLRTIVMECRNLNESVGFWQGKMGFRVIKSAPSSSLQWCLLRIKSIFPVWSPELLLVQTGIEPMTAYIDDRGWTCFSLLVTRIDRMLDRLSAAGAAEIGEPFILQRDGKPVRLCFLRGPDREIVELVEIG
ncbi:MAG: VOC family protein [Solirubrobacterales bacterium]